MDLTQIGIGSRHIPKPLSWPSARGSWTRRSRRRRRRIVLLDGTREPRRAEGAAVSYQLREFQAVLDGHVQALRDDAVDDLVAERLQLIIFAGYFDVGRGHPQVQEAPGGRNSGKPENLSKALAKVVEMGALYSRATAATPNLQLRMALRQTVGFSSFFARQHGLAEFNWDAAGGSGGTVGGLGQAGRPRGAVFSPAPLALDPGGTAWAAGNGLGTRLRFGPCFSGQTFACRGRRTCGHCC